MDAKDVITNKSVGIPKWMITVIAERAIKENRSFSNMLVLLVNRQLDTEKAVKDLKVKK